MIDNKKLMLTAIKKFVYGIVLLGLLLFINAGDMHYWNAWIYLIIFAASIFVFGVYLYVKNKELLQKRLDSKEKEEEQSNYTFMASISLFLMFVVCGLDYRFGWSAVPIVAIIIALIIMLVGYGLFVITLIQNSYASRIVEIQDRQKVIDTGVYSVIRHPMYTAALIMFFSSPIVLGSLYALIPTVFFLIGIIHRIRNEEKVLAAGLEGYSDYKQLVRYRLIPFVW
jgi:protein-S-isoprenylcysteine O-methyltransferase Ste14